MVALLLPEAHAEQFDAAFVMRTIVPGYGPILAVMLAFFFHTDETRPQRQGNETQDRIAIGIAVAYSFIPTMLLLGNNVEENLPMFYASAQPFVADFLVFYYGATARA
jgi:hypothetical protein